MPSLSKSMLPLENIRADENTLERIDLLEKVQGNHDWLASVVADRPEDRQYLTALQEHLEKKGGYSSHMEQDHAGRDVLRLHHVGRETGLHTGFEKLGAMGGLKHAAQNSAAAIGDGAGIAAKGVKYTVEDPARLLAGLYAFGDAMYAGSGGDLASVQDKLKSFAGWMGLAQSAIFVAFAKDGSEYHLNNLHTQMEDAARVTSGGHGLEIDGRRAQHEKIMHDQMLDPLPLIIDPLKKNPIDIGSAAHITGQLGLIVSGGLRMKETNGQQGSKDIARSVLSIASWLMLNVAEEHTENKTEWTRNPVERAWQEFREVPQRYASATTLGASLAGLASSHEMDNVNQALAEMAYLVGDGAMFFARKSDYGDASGQDTTAAAKAATAFIEHSPVLFSPSEQTAFVHKLSEYIANRIVSERVETENLPDNDPVHAMKAEMIADTAQSLATNIFKELSGKDQPIDQVANNIARISEKFPADQRADVHSALVETIDTLPGVFIKAEELEARVKLQHARFENREESPLSPPTMSVVAEELSELTFQLPAVNAGYNASRLFDTLSEMTQQSPVQDKIFEQALYQKALDDTGISPAMAQAMANDKQAVSTSR